MSIQLVKDIFEFTLWHVVHAQCYSHKKRPKEEDRTTSWSRFDTSHGGRCQNNFKKLSITDPVCHFYQFLCQTGRNDGLGRMRRLVFGRRQNITFLTTCPKTMAFHGADHDAFAVAVAVARHDTIVSNFKGAVHDAITVLSSPRFLCRFHPKCPRVIRPRCLPSRHPRCHRRPSLMPLQSPSKLPSNEPSTMSSKSTSRLPSKMPSQSPSKVHWRCPPRSHPRSHRSRPAFQNRYVLRHTNHDWLIRIPKHIDWQIPLFSIFPLQSTLCIFSLSATTLLILNKNKRTVRKITH